MRSQKISFFHYNARLMVVAVRCAMVLVGLAMIGDSRTGVGLRLQ